MTTTITRRGEGGVGLGVQEEIREIERAIGTGTGLIGTGEGTGIGIGEVRCPVLLLYLFGTHKALCSQTTRTGTEITDEIGRPTVEMIGEGGTSATENETGIGIAVTATELLAMTGKETVTTHGTVPLHLGPRLPILTVQVRLTMPSLALTLTHNCPRILITQIHQPQERPAPQSAHRPAKEAQRKAKRWKKSKTTTTLL